MHCRKLMVPLHWARVGKNSGNLVIWGQKALSLLVAVSLASYWRVIGVLLTRTPESFPNCFRVFASYCRGVALFRIGKIRELLTSMLVKSCWVFPKFQNVGEPWRGFPNSPRAHYEFSRTLANFCVFPNCTQNHWNGTTRGQCNGPISLATIMKLWWMKGRPMSFE